MEGKCICQKTFSGNDEFEFIKGGVYSYTDFDGGMGYVYVRFDDDEIDWFRMNEQTIKCTRQVFNAMFLTLKEERKLKLKKLW